MGVSPSYKKSPKIGGYRGLIETVLAVSLSDFKGNVPENIQIR